ncbi:MAG: hypothetical protein M3Q48_01010 [Actinomycetota bacterium]|nr:hypothetical protein [Actinomycetota bacterium]
MKRNFGTEDEVVIGRGFVRRRLVLEDADVRAIQKNFGHENPHALNLYAYGSVFFVSFQAEEQLRVLPYPKVLTVGSRWELEGLAVRRLPRLAGLKLPVVDIERRHTHDGKLNAADDERGSIAAGPGGCSHPARPRSSRRRARHDSCRIARPGGDAAASGTRAQSARSAARRCARLDDRMAADWKALHRQRSVSLRPRVAAVRNHGVWWYNASGEVLRGSRNLLSARSPPDDTPHEARSVTGPSLYRPRSSEQHASRETDQGEQYDDCNVDDRYEQRDDDEDDEEDGQDDGDRGDEAFTDYVEATGVDVSGVTSSSHRLPEAAMEPPPERFGSQAGHPPSLDDPCPAVRSNDGAGHEHEGTQPTRPSVSEIRP